MEEKRIDSIETRLFVLETQNQDQEKRLAVLETQSLNHRADNDRNEKSIASLKEVIGDLNKTVSEFKGSVNTLVWVIPIVSALLQWMVLHVSK